MDTEQFDTLARSLTDRRSRRGALTAALAGGLVLASLAETDAKKKCPPYKKRKKGKCKKKLPDGTVCPGGMCEGGSCVPSCDGACSVTPGDPNISCTCCQTQVGTARCARYSGPSLQLCVTDADCADHGAGAFCPQHTNCCGGICAIPC